MQSFSPRDYHADARCPSLVQDQRGLMYIANRALVLEYDGSSWRSLSAGDGGWINALAYEPGTDRVYVGGENVLGYLETTPGGERVFVSLLARLPAEARAFGQIRRVYATPAGVFFLGEKGVLRQRDGQFKSWSMPAASRLRGGWAGDNLYIHSPETGLLLLKDNAFVPASDEPVFRQAKVRTVTAGANGGLLVATSHDGLFTLQGGVAAAWDSAFNAILKDKGILEMLLLRDGTLAIATETAGLILLDKDGRFRNHVDEAGGLHGNNILGLFEDAEEGLWLGLQTGVTHAEIHSPLSILRAGPSDDLSSIYCGDLWFGKPILANYTGLYTFVGADPSTATGAHLERFHGITETFFSALTVENGLLLSAPGKVMLLNANAALTTVFTTGAARPYLYSSRLHPAQIFVTEENGHVSTLRFDGSTHQWINGGIVADLGKPGYIFGLGESAQGDLWLGTEGNGLFRVRPASNGKASVVTSLLDEPGPLHSEAQVWVSWDGGPISITTPTKLYRLDEQGQNVRLATEFGQQFCDGTYRNLGVGGYDEHSIWVIANRASVSDGEQVYGRAIAEENGQSPVFRSLPRKVATVLGALQAYLPIDNQPDTLLISGSDGILRLDLARWNAQQAPRPFSTVLRRALTTNEESPVDGLPAIVQGAMPYTRNSVHFEYAASTLAIDAHPRFQTRLVGFGGGKWSEFSERTSVDYTNLPEGGYLFEVRARNADEQLGRVASRTFRILAPWQRTPWAYAAFLLALVLGVGFLLRWRGQQLRRQNVTLETLVDTRTSELRGREAELVRARDDAESANRAKSAFLANMSHELRTPLNAILGYSQVLLKNPNFDPRSREQVTVIGQSGNHLLAMINEVLDLSKVEAGKLTLVPSDFSLGQLLDDVSATFRTRLVEKGLEFRQDRAPNLPPVVHADVGRLRQVLYNLLSNAVKFTRRGTVQLVVKPMEDGRVCFEVSDTGVGIATDQLHAIFEAFHQAAGSDLAAQGTGLGLAISQRLVGLMGGQIQVESTPGEGSRFWFELPLVSDPVPGTMTAREQPADAPGIITGYQGAMRRLLLVDDERENRRVLRDLLQPFGFEIEEAADGKQCLEECARHLPDAVLLDLRLGQRLDGFEVARTLRARAGSARLGIIAVSASVFESNRQQAIDAGCDDFLPKPFEEAQLLAVLGRVLGLRWNHAANEVVAMAADLAVVEDLALPPAEIDAMLELSLRGDIVGLRHRLDALRIPGASAGSKSLARVVEPLIASFQVEQLHARLVQLKAHTNV